MLVFDLTRPETFQSVLKWKREIDSKVRGRQGNGCLRGDAILCAMDSSDAECRADTKSLPPYPLPWIIMTL